MQWTDGNGTNQQFRLADSDGGYVRLINRNSNKAVEVQGASTADGGNIVQYDDWDGTNQQWQLVRVGAPTRRAHRRRSTYTNPVVWQDFADVDIIRVGDTYYYVGVDHALLAGRAGPALVRPGQLGVRRPLGARGSTSAPSYDLNGGRAYVKGIWASTLNYRPSNRTFYWVGLHRLRPDLRLHRLRRRRHLDQAHARSTTATTTPGC